MSKLRIKGKLMYPPGIWGLNLPVKNVKIKLYDIDKTGSDFLWEGTTDSNGHFSGTTREWQDKILIRTPAIPAGFGFPGVPATKKYIPDLSDLLILKIKITDGNHNLEGPFPFVRDNVEVPLFTTWGPPPLVGPSRGTINGKEFTDFNGLINEMVSVIETGGPIELKLYNDWATAVRPLTDLINMSPLQCAQQIFPDSRSGSLELVVGGAVIVITAVEIAALAGLVLAIAGLLVASSVPIFAVALGVAVIIAISTGYGNLNTEEKTVTTEHGVETERRVEITK